MSMNVLKNFDKLTNKFTVLLEENKYLQIQHKSIQGENLELKEREKQFQQHVLNLERQKKELEEKFQQHILNLERQKKELEEQFQQHIINLDRQNQELKEREKQFQQHIINLERQKKELEDQFQDHVLDLDKQNLELIERETQFQQHIISLDDENQELKEREEQFQQHILNLDKQNQELKKRENQFQQHIISLDEQNQELKEGEEQFQQHILNLDKQNQELKKREKQFQQYVLDSEQQKKELEDQFQQYVLNLELQKKELEEKFLIEKQKNEQLEMISQSLEKTLGNLGLDSDSDSDSENDIIEKNEPLIDDPTTFSLIDYNNDENNIIEKNEPLIDNSTTIPLIDINNDENDVKEKNEPLIDNSTTMPIIDDNNDENDVKEKNEPLIETTPLIDDNNDENDVKEKNKPLIDNPTTFSLIDDNNDSIQLIEDPSKRSSDSSNKEKFDENSSPSQKDDIRAVVGLDFGTTYSGFSYCHISANKEDIYTNDKWPGGNGSLKTNTVLQYDQNNNLTSWGAPNRKRKYNNNNNKPVESLKLHLGKLRKKPILPVGLDYKTAISDYLREIGKVIKETIVKRWPMIDFYENVLLVLTVPAEFDHNAIHIMRECAYKAALINDKNSTNLQFITEPEAAAVYCMRDLKEHSLAQPANFMVIDCGGGTVDLTTCKLENGRLSEITERTREFCGSTFIDAEFISYLESKIGYYPIYLLRTNHFGQIQHMVREFCRNIKDPFTGDDPTFRYEIDLEEACPVLKQYISGRVLESLEEDDWVIEIDFNTIKSMFDPVVWKIIFLVREQLYNSSTPCSAIFLVGGFSESEYLQKRIKQEFRDIVVSVPNNPIATISRGAVMYGLSSIRVLKYTYGIKVRKYWVKEDPIERKLRNGLIDRFHCLAMRGTKITVNEKFMTTFTPISPIQQIVTFSIFYTSKRDIKYCDEPDVMLLGTLTIDIPVSGPNCLLLFEFIFGTVEIAVNVKNARTGQVYTRTRFALDI